MSRRANGVDVVVLPKRSVFRFGNYQNGVYSALVIVFGAGI